MSELSEFFFLTSLSSVILFVSLLLLCVSVIGSERMETLRGLAFIIMLLCIFVCPLTFIAGILSMIKLTFNF